MSAMSRRWFESHCSWRRGALAGKHALSGVAILCFAAGPGCGGPTAFPGPDPERVVSEPREPSFAETWNRSAFDHGLWDAVLQKHVNDQGLVDYGAIGEDARFREYLFRLANTDAAGLADDRQRLAFWINAYNALTIKAVLETLPKDRARWSSYSIKDQTIGGKTIWQALRFQVGGGTWTLDQIEHEILGGEAFHHDPRTHLVIVCAARGCPKLWNRAYDPRHIDKQLSGAVLRNVEDPDQFQIDESNRTLKLNKVFKWYGEDFSSPDASPNAPTVPAFLGKYIPDPPLTRSMTQDVWKLEYSDYDWKLNIAPAPGED